MGKSCCVPFCKSRWTSSPIGEPNPIFHPFPRAKKMKKLWNLKIFRKKGPTISSVVCNKHFKPEDSYFDFCTGNYNKK